MRKRTEEKLIEKSRRLNVRAERLSKEAREAQNKANAVRIYSALEGRLAPYHYKLIRDLSERGLVEFRIAPDYYLIAIEDRKVLLRLIKAEQIQGLEHKSLHGTSYPLRMLAGYYCGFGTPETTGRADLGDRVYVNPSLPEPKIRARGMINIPLEAIVGYKILSKRRRGLRVAN